MWTHLQDELILVQRELEDCKSMEEWAWQCQVTGPSPPVYIIVEPPNKAHIGTIHVASR